MAITLQSIFIFTVLLIIQTGRVKSDGISYEDNKYNLENGPVLYEAYYPDANIVDQSQNTSPNKLYQQIPVIEKSYQRPYSHNYQDQIIDDQQDYPEIINQHNSQPIESYTNQQQQQQQQQQKASLEEALNIIINAIRQKNIESHPVYKNYQVPLNFPPNEPRITESGKFVFPNENYRTYEKHGPVDDIYKARPHIFNSIKQPQNIKSFFGNNNNNKNNNEDEKRMSLFKNNLTQMKEINVDKPQVASIQVSQQQQQQQQKQQRRQHKHRHHHGENIQSNYQRPLTSI